MDTLCERCVKDPVLIRYIEQKGTIVEVCSICQSKDVRAVDQESADLEQLIRAVVRFNLDEWEYNHHEGGIDLQPLIIQERYFFSEQFLSSGEQAEDFIYNSLDQGYYDADKGVSLYYGYDQHGQLAGILTAIQYSGSKFEKSIIQLAKQKEYKQLLDSVARTIDYCEKYIRAEPKKLVLYRARLGIKGDGYEAGDIQYRRRRYYAPYQNSEIGPAPLERVDKGRMNRQGFSFLYLAEDVDTAVHEIRPAPGDKISVGMFTQVNDITIADFTQVDLLDFYRTDNELDIFEELYHLNKFLSHPIGTDQSYRYLYTQLLAEELIRRGFNGIKFSSSLTDKANYAVFSPNSFTWDSKEQHVFAVTKMQLTYDPLPLMKDGEEYTSF